MDGKWEGVAGRNRLGLQIAMLLIDFLELFLKLLILPICV